MHIQLSTAVYSRSEFYAYILFQGPARTFGYAHGLMAVSALEMIHHPSRRTCGWLTSIVVVGKSACEFRSGGVDFEFMPMGMCGRPLVACQGGGVIGAILAIAFVRALRRANIYKPSNALTCRINSSGSLTTFLDW